MHTLKRLFPYLWEYKWRVLAALAFMIGAKVANVGVPLLLKNLVDAMSLKPGDAQAVLVVPAALLLGYGLLRLSTTPCVARHSIATRPTAMISCCPVLSMLSVFWLLMAAVR